MKKIDPIVIIGIGLTIACLAFFVSGSHFIQAVSQYAYDGFLKRVHSDPRSGKIAIVDLDDSTLKKEGQWPWPRYKVAKLNDSIFDAGARVIGYDIVFAEKDRTSPATLKRDIKEYFDQEVQLSAFPSNLVDFDAIFAESLMMGDVVLGCGMHPSDNVNNKVNYDSDPNYVNRIMIQTQTGVPEEKAYEFMMQASDITIAIPALTEISSSGFFNAKLDSDGIVRVNPLIWALGRNRIYPALSLETVRLFMGGQVRIVYDQQGITSIRIKDRVIPTTKYGGLVVNYRSIKKNAKTGFVTSFPTYSAMDVMSGNIPTNALDGKIVFVGASAVGLKDVKASPLTENLSGVEVHATMADNILYGDMLKAPDWMVAVNAFAILVIGVFLTVFISKGKSWLSFLVSLALILLSIKISLVVLEKKHIVYVPVWVVLAVVVIYPVLTMIKFWQEEHQKKRVRNMFGTMVSQDVLKYLENNPDSFSLSGQRAEATMFFSDVAGFTTISESLEPEQLSELLNRYLSPMTTIIMKRHGYVDKYEGDAIMAEWGVPFPMKDHAVQACHAAIEQQEELAELRPWLKKAFGHELIVRMGINSGAVTAGNMGSDRRFQYTVMGDAVNQAARFEPANKEYGTSIMIGESTYREARAAIDVRLLDKIVVKGKTKPINIYELIAKKGEMSAEKTEIVGLYEKALQLHWDREWDDAIKCLNQALELDPGDGPSVRMLHRVKYYKENPPAEGWGGEYVRTTKD